VKIAWNVLLQLVYLAVVIGILSVADSRFETLVLAGLVQLYTAVLYNFSVLAVNADINKLRCAGSLQDSRCRTRQDTGRRGARFY
jgi:hypothetical protein